MFSRFFLRQGTPSGGIRTKIGAGAEITPYSAIPFIIFPTHIENRIYSPISSQTNANTNTMGLNEIILIYQRRYHRSKI